MENMANRIAQALNDKNGGNQSELARYVGVTPQAVQKWIAGESEPKGKNLSKVAEFVGVSEVVLKFGADAHGAGTPQAPQLQAVPPPKAEDAPPSTEEIIELLRLFSEASPSGRKFIIKSARAAQKRVADSGAVVNKS